MKKIISFVFIILCQIVFFGNQNDTSCKLLVNDKEIPQIMMINSYHKGFKWTDDIVDTFMARIREKHLFAEFYIEYLDTKRTFEKEHFENLYLSFKTKYKDKKPDIVVVSDDDALNFVEKHYDEFFLAYQLFIVV